MAPTPRTENPLTTTKKKNIRRTTTLDFYCYFELYALQAALHLQQTTTRQALSLMFELYALIVRSCLWCPTRQLSAFPLLPLDLVNCFHWVTMVIKRDNEWNHGRFSGASCFRSSQCSGNEKSDIVKSRPWQLIWPGLKNERSKNQLKTRQISHRAFYRNLVHCKMCKMRSAFLLFYVHWQLWWVVLKAGPAIIYNTFQRYW